MHRVWKIFFTILVLVVRLTATMAAHDQKGFISLTNSSRIRVLLECGSKIMSVKLLFNTSMVREFKDWIVVGATNRQECRQQGTGELQYLIEIPVILDPCGTKMVESGVFENSISVKKHPYLILQGDELVTVRCVYGPPEISKVVIPPFPPSQAAQPLTSASPPIIQASIQPTVAVGTIYLVVFLILFLALLFLLCGCLVFFFKRRKLRIERRKKILLAVPQGSELSKLGLQRLWWTGKSTASNDALLSHDYMVSSNSTREQLSISTEYAADTPSSSSGGTVSPPTSRYPDQLYVHESKHMIPKPHMDTVVRAPGVIRSLQSIPEERNEVAKSCATEETEEKQDEDASSSSGDFSREPAMNLNLSAVYGQVDTSRKHQQSSIFGRPTNDIDLDQVNFSRTCSMRAGGGGGGAGGGTSELPSISELYTFPVDKTRLEDTESLSTLEGRQYYPLNVCNEKETTRNTANNNTVPVSVEIHCPFQPPLPPSPPPPPPPPPPPIQTLNNGGGKSGGSTKVDKKIDLDVYVKVIEQHKGAGPQKLTESDVKKWADLVRNNERIQNIIAKAKTLEDFDAISHDVNFEHEYNREKWALIIQSLAHVAFLKQLNEILDNQNQSNIRASMKKHLPPLPTKLTEPVVNGPPTVVRPKPASEQRIFKQKPEPEQRIFTRESYCEIKQEVESANSSSDETILSKHSFDPMIMKNSDTPNSDDSKSEMNEEPADQPCCSNINFRERSSSELLENPPTLSIYLGNVPSRAVNPADNSDGYECSNYYYNNAGINSEVASIYGTTS